MKAKKAIFILQLTEHILKVTKCLLGYPAKREFVGLESELIPLNCDDKKITEIIEQVFRRLGYNNHPVIITLARNQAILRYLKIPSQSPREIEGIIPLQASQYLPYPANELITGYQSISVDKEGYSYINLVIVRRDVVERYLKVFGKLNIKNVIIALSSYGLCNLYTSIKSKDIKVMIIDIDSQQVEIVIASQKKLLFSRYFKINRNQANWQGLFIDEINKTQDAYLKETSREAPSKIILVGVGKFLPEYAEILKDQSALPVEILSYEQNKCFSKNVLEGLLNSEHSFTSLFGLGLEDIPKSLNLLPEEIKRGIEKISKYKEYLRLSLFITGIIFILSLGIIKDLDNKAQYLKRLKVELDKIINEAKPLEEIEKRFQLLENRYQKKPTSLDVLYEFHQILPAQVSLVNLSYEEDNQVVLRGQTAQLNAVFDFVSQLEKSNVFKNFNIKVRYATSKKTQAGEMVDFEIVCLKK